MATLYHFTNTILTKMSQPEEVPGDIGLTIEPPQPPASAPEATSATEAAPSSPRPVSPRFLSGSYSGALGSGMLQASLGGSISPHRRLSPQSNFLRKPSSSPGRAFAGAGYGASVAVDHYMASSTASRPEGGETGGGLTTATADATSEVGTAAPSEAGAAALGAASATISADGTPLPTPGLGTSTPAPQGEPSEVEERARSPIPSASQDVGGIEQRPANDVYEESASPVRAAGREKKSNSVSDDDRYVEEPSASPSRLDVTAACGASSGPPTPLEAAAPSYDDAETAAETAAEMAEATAEEVAAASAPSDNEIVENEAAEVAEEEQPAAPHAADAIPTAEADAEDAEEPAADAAAVAVAEPVASKNATAVYAEAATDEEPTAVDAERPAVIDAEEPAGDDAEEPHTTEANDDAEVSYDADTVAIDGTSPIRTYPMTADGDATGGAEAAESGEVAGRRRESADTTESVNALLEQLDVANESDADVPPAATTADVGPAADDGSEHPPHADVDNVPATIAAPPAEALVVVDEVRPEPTSLEGTPDRPLFVAANIAIGDSAPLFASPSVDEFEETVCRTPPTPPQADADADAEGDDSLGLRPEEALAGTVASMDIVGVSAVSEGGRGGEGETEGATSPPPSSYGPAQDAPAAHVGYGYDRMRAAVDGMQLSAIEAVDPSVGFSTHPSDRTLSLGAPSPAAASASTPAAAEQSDPPPATSPVRAATPPAAEAEAEPEGGELCTSPPSAAPMSIVSLSPAPPAATDMPMGGGAAEADAAPTPQPVDVPTANPQYPTDEALASGTPRPRSSASPRRQAPASLHSPTGSKGHLARDRSQSYTPNPSGGAPSSSTAAPLSAARARTMTVGPMAAPQASAGDSSSALLSRADSGTEKEASGSKPLTRARSRTLDRSAGISPNIAATVSRLAANLPSRRGQAAANASGAVSTSGSLAASRSFAHMPSEGSAVPSPLAASASFSGVSAGRRVTRQPSGSFRMVGGRPQSTPFTQRGREEAERRREEERRRAEAERIEAEAEARRAEENESRASLMAEVADHDRQIQALKSLIKVRQATEEAEEELNRVKPRLQLYRAEQQRHFNLSSKSSIKERSLGEKRALIQHLEATIKVMGKKLPEWRSSLDAMLKAMATEVDALTGLTEALAAREQSGFSSSEALSSIREVVEIDQSRFGVLAGLLAKVKAAKEEERHRDRELYGLDELIEAATLSAAKSHARRERIAKAADFCDYSKLLHESSSDESDGGDGADDCGGDNGKGGNISTSAASTRRAHMRAASAEEMAERLQKEQRKARARSVMVRAGVDFKDVVEDEEAGEGHRKHCGFDPLSSDSDGGGGAFGSAANTNGNKKAFDDPRRQLRQKRAADRRVKRLHVQRMKAEHALEVRRLLQQRALLVAKVKDQQVTNRRQGVLGLSDLFERAIETVRRGGGGEGADGNGDTANSPIHLHPRNLRSVSGGASLTGSFSMGGLHSPTGGLGTSSFLNTPPMSFLSNDADPLANDVHNLAPSSSAAPSIAATVPPNTIHPHGGGVGQTSYDRVVERALTRKIDLLADASARAAAQIEGLRGENAEMYMANQMSGIMISEARGLHGRATDAREAELWKVRQAKRQAMADNDALQRQLKVQRHRAGNALRGDLLGGPAMRVVDGRPFVGKDLWAGGAVMVGAQSGLNDSDSAANKEEAAGESNGNEAGETADVNVPEFNAPIIVRDLFDIIDIKLGLKDPREVVLGGRSSLSASASASAAPSVSASGGVAIHPPFKVSRHLDAALVRSMRNPSDVAVDDPFYATPEVLDIIYNRGEGADGADGIPQYTSPSRAGTTRRGTTAIVRGGKPVANNAAASGGESVFSRLAGTRTAAAASREAFTREELTYRATHRATFGMPTAPAAPTRRATTPSASRK